MMSKVNRNGDRTDWFFRLCEGLERLNVKVAFARALCGEAQIILGEEERLVVTLTRNNDGKGPAFGRAQGLFLWYQGARDLSSRQRRALMIVLRLLDGTGIRVPLDLDSPHTRGLDSMPSHQAIAFAFPFCTAERSLGQEGPRLREVLVRTTGKCNQACPFCSAPASPYEPSISAYSRLIERLASEEYPLTLTLTGGEPTLRSDLVWLTRIALEGLPQSHMVELQTNAVRLAKPELVESFPQQKRLQFFVSLHAMEAEIYDRCTASKGMLEPALSGIGSLLSRGHEVMLSCVTNRWNYDHLDEYVEAVARRFSKPKPPKLSFSINLCPKHRQGASGCLVSYSELAPQLESAIERARALGIAVEPLLSSSHASIPACFLASSFRLRRSPPIILEHQIGSEAGEGGRGGGWVKSPQCRECVEMSRCPGLPEDYARRFGIEELKPL